MVNAMRSLSGATVVYLLCALLTGCDGDKRKYGSDFDGERQKRGIPPLGTNVSTMSDWGASWVYDFVDHGRTSKNAEIKNGQIISETDTYYSGTIYRLPDGSGWPESLKITYSYEAERHGSDPWSAVYWSSNRTDALSLEASEKLLGSWGLRRIDQARAK